MLVLYFMVNAPLYLAFTMLTAGWNHWGGKPGCCADTAIKTWLAKNLLCYIIMVSIAFFILLVSYWHVSSAVLLDDFNTRLNKTTFWVFFLTAMYAIKIEVICVWNTISLFKEGHKLRTNDVKEVKYMFLAYTLL